MSKDNSDLLRVKLKDLRKLVFKKVKKLLNAVLRGNKEFALMRVKGKGFSEETVVQLKTGILLIQTLSEEDSKDLAIFEARKNESSRDYEEFIKQEEPELWKDIQNIQLIEELD